MGLRLIICVKSFSTTYRLATIHPLQTTDGRRQTTTVP